MKQVSDIKTEHRELSPRERALVERGYPAELVARLSGFSGAELNEAAERIFPLITAGCVPQAKPHCIFLGGQAGAGKSTWSRSFCASSEQPYVQIGLDAYRTAHPRYAEMEGAIRAFWQDRVPDDDHSPGNDIADFTHSFAGAVTDLLIDLAAERRLNLVLEWGLRNPEEPLKLMERLKRDGYRITVLYIAADPQTSMAACRLRADVMNSSGHIMRRVTKQFHDLMTAAMPESCRTVYENAVGRGLCADFRVLDRRGECLWTIGDPGAPDAVYRAYLSHTAERTENDPAEARRALNAERIGARFPQ